MMTPTEINVLAAKLTGIRVEKTTRDNCYFYTVFINDKPQPQTYLTEEMAWRYTGEDYCGRYDCAFKLLTTLKDDDAWYAFYRELSEITEAKHAPSDAVKLRLFFTSTPLQITVAVLRVHGIEVVI